MQDVRWIPLLVLFACSTKPSDSASESACDENMGRVWGNIVDFDGELHGGSTVVNIHPEDEETYALPAVEDGAYEVQLAPGHYRFTAESSWGCFADPEPEEDVQACGEHQVDLIMDLCFGR